MGARGAVQTPVQEETRTPSPVCMRDARRQGGLFANPESLLAQVPVTMCQSSRAGAQQWRWRAGNNSRGIALSRSRAAYTAWWCALRMCSLNPCAEHEQGFVSAVCAAAAQRGRSMMGLRCLPPTRGSAERPGCCLLPASAKRQSALVRDGFEWDSHHTDSIYRILIRISM